MDSHEKIIACSTSTHANCALGVVRLSGFDNLQHLSPAFCDSFLKLTPRHARLVKIQFDGQVYDQVIALFFKGPNSYNGENILELHVHGNQLSITQIIAQFIDRLGFRHARPGEFTLRALKNKKMTLSQVEGLDIFLNAQSQMGLAQSQKMLYGELDLEYQKLRQKFIQLKAAVELGIDFMDDVGEASFLESLAKSWGEFKEAAHSLNLRTSYSGELLEPSVVIYGAPNAGKSTLFNLLLNKDRAIVDSEAGTTRDYLTEKWPIADHIFRLIDTAGIRSTGHRVEAQGIQKSKDLLANSFFKIGVIGPNDANLGLMQSDLYVMSHADQDHFQLGDYRQPDAIYGSFTCSGPIGPLKKKAGPMGPKSESGPIGPLGKEQIKEQVAAKVLGKFEEITSLDPIVAPRHKHVIQGLWGLVDEFDQVIGVEKDVSILASEINNMGGLIEELIGIVTPDHVFKNLFENFCIGK